jgi:hypothetical protein
MMEWGRVLRHRKGRFTEGRFRASFWGGRTDDSQPEELEFEDCDEG